MEKDSLLADERFLPAAKNLIQAARRSIDITTYKAEIIDKPRGKKLKYFFELLFVRRSEGIPVRFMLPFPVGRVKAPTSNLWARQELRRHLINTRQLPHSRCCHAKVIIVDSRWAIIGSHNLSVKSCGSNFEVSYLSCDTAIVNNLVRVFNATWDKTIL